MTKPMRTAAPAWEHPSGYDLLHDPRLNKGTAFTEAERRASGLEGLLPPAVTSIELQVARRHAEIANLDDDLQKYLVLSDLQARNETLFYAVLMSDPATFMPLVYTPTVGEACQKFDHIFRPRARHVSADQRARAAAGAACATGRNRTCASSSSPTASASSGSAISASAAWASRSASSRSTPPAPACRRNTACRSSLDVGTTITTLLDDPLYLGLRQQRVRGDEYVAFVDEFVAAVQAALPEMLHPVGGLRQHQRRADPGALSRQDLHLQRRHPGHRRRRAGRHLRRVAHHRTEARRPALPVPRRRLGGDRHRRADQPGHGAGGRDLAAARRAQRAVRRQWPDGRPRAPTSPTSRSRSRRTGRRSSTFVEAVEALRPTGIIGVSTVPKLFNQEVIEAMAEINERPIIFPYSNPTSRSECTAEEAYRWSDGRAIFASGSPFPPVEIAGRRFVPGQGNNVYIFPAMGMAVFATEATRVTEEMFIVAAQAVAEQVTEENLAMGLIYPPQSHILDASLHVAERVATYIFDHGLARVPRPDDVGALIRARAYRPVYPE